MGKTSKKRHLLPLLLIVFLLAGILTPTPVKAANIKKAKPKFTKSCAYLNNKIYLQWSKVKGAKKYVVQRAKINPKTGKTGKWKNWKTTKKRSIKVKGSGDYKYRVRGVRGKKYSKWSSAKRIFSANAKIVETGYTPPDIMFGVTLSAGRLEFKVSVGNKSQSEMGFVESGSRFGDQNTLYAINKSTGKVVKKWIADLDTGSFTAIAKQVNAKKTQTLYFEIYGFSEEDWALLKNSKMMVTSSFYPNPEVEDISTQMAISYTGNVKESSIAAK